MIKRLLTANIGTFLTVVTFAFSFLFVPAAWFSLSIVFFAVFCCIYLHEIAFEYQRITLTIGRCLKMREKNKSMLGVVDIQLFLSPPGFLIGLLLLENAIFGVLLGYSLQMGLAYFLILFLLKYVLAGLLPIPVPHTLLFRLIDTRMGNASKEILLLGGIEAMMQLITLYKEMPHNKTYENWAFQQYGTDLLHQKL